MCVYAERERQLLAAAVPCRGVYVAQCVCACERVPMCVCVHKCKCVERAAGSSFTWSKKRGKSESRERENAEGDQICWR